MEIIFTNHDLLTSVMPFANGGYYNYDRLIYKAGQDESIGVSLTKISHSTAGYYLDLQGRHFEQRPTVKGIYIYCNGNNNEKVVNLTY